MFKKLMAATALIVAGTSVHAVPITITPYGDANAINTALDSFETGNFVQEDFEGFGADPKNAGVVFENASVTTRETFAGSGINFGELTSAGIDTEVGTIKTHGNFTGGGTTCQNLSLDGPTCSDIALQFDPDLNGQGNIIPTDGQWSLNAADTGGFVWKAENILVPSIGKIVFALRDAADQGATVSVSTTVDNVVYTETRSGLGNNNLQLIEIAFGFPGVTFADIIISNSKKNDSMSIDGLTLVGATQPPPEVPLPASGLLLIGAVGALALRRKKA